MEHFYRYDDVMEQQYWSERWQTGQTGFNLGRPHDLLTKHHDLIAKAHRVYVPLCGKAKDLIWLRDHGHDVTGSEIVPQAIAQLMADEALLPTHTRRGAFKLHITPKLTVLEGDAVAIDVDVAGSFDAVYDRAAFVALPPEMRAGYVKSLLRVLKPGGHIFLIGFLYDQQKLAGPPFAADEALVRAAFAGCDVRVVDERAEEAGPRFVAAGVVDVKEIAFVIEKR